MGKVTVNFYVKNVCNALKIKQNNYKAYSITYLEMITIHLDLVTLCGGGLIAMQAFAGFE